MVEKNYWNKKKEFTRKELVMFGLACSVPIAGWLGLLLVCIFKTESKNTRWK